MKKLLLIILLIPTVCYAQTFDIAVVGDGYKQQALFLSDLERCKNDFFIRPPMLQRQAQFNFIPLSWRNKFQCSQSNTWEGSSCNDTKVVNEVRSHGVNAHAILVLAANLTGGGGGAVAVAGMKNHDANAAAVCTHELGHSLFGFADGSGGNMSGNYYSSTFTLEQQTVINHTIDLKAAPFNAVPPAVMILSPQNNRLLKLARNNKRYFVQFFHNI